jgi:hypothetical protein
LAPPNVDNAREPDLKQMLDDINRRHITLALEGSLLVRDDTCRSNTEAYGNPGATEHLLQKIKRNGGDLRYLIMTSRATMATETQGRPLVTSRPRPWQRKSPR